MSNIESIRGVPVVHLNYDQFKRYYSEHKVQVVVDNVAAINAAKYGIIKAKGTLVYFYLAWTLLLASFPATIVHWSMFIFGFIIWSFLLNKSKQIRNDALEKACVDNEEIYNVCTNNGGVYVVSRNPEVLADDMFNSVAEPFAKIAQALRHQSTSKSAQLKGHSIVEKLEDDDEDERDYHSFFDIKYKEISNFFIDNNLFNDSIKSDVAAIKFVHLATCCADSTLQDNSYAASISYKILGITKEKWDSSGAITDENGKILSYVDYCSPYEVELIDQFGITKISAIKKVLTEMGIKGDDPIADSLLNLFDETIEYARLEIVPRIRNAFG